MRGTAHSVHIERGSSEVVLTNSVIAALGIWGGHRTLDTIRQEVVNARNLRRMFPVLIHPNNRPSVVKVKELIGDSGTGPPHVRVRSRFKSTTMLMIIPRRISK